MPSFPVLIDHAYPVSYVPRSGRNVREAWVAGRAPAAIEVLDDAPVAVEMRRVLKPYPMLDTDPDTVAETYRLVGGGLSLRVDGPEGPMGAEALAGVDPAAPHEPWRSRGWPFQEGEPVGDVAAHMELLAPKLVRSDGRLAAEARIAGLARRTAIVGGHLHAPSSEPVWGVRAVHACGVIQVAACRVSDHDRGQTVAMFRADRLDRAVAVAEALAAGVVPDRPERAGRVQVVGGIDVLRPEALRFDEMTFNATAHVRWLSNHSGTRGFASLPVPVLRAWTDFREAAELWAGGRADMLMEAMSALARCRAALPEERDADPRSARQEAVDLLKRQTTGFREMVAFWEADRAGPVPDEDAVALSAALR